jgi:hypothetical protein
MDTYDTFSSSHAATDRRLLKLARRLDGARSARETVRVVYAIAATRHPQAVELLAGLLGTREEVVARVVMRALLSFGRAAATAAARVAAESSDPHAVTHARIVLRSGGFARRPTEAARRREPRAELTEEHNDNPKERT